MRCHQRLWSLGSLHELVREHYGSTRVNGKLRFLRAGGLEIDPGVSTRPWSFARRDAADHARLGVRPMPGLIPVTVRDLDYGGAASVQRKPMRDLSLTRMPCCPMRCWSPSRGSRIVRARAPEGGSKDTE